MIFPRFLRNLRAAINYPFWLLHRKAPDNHLYKMKRIKKIAKQYHCDSLIETGTFYGQTVDYARKILKKVMSVEIYEPLYDFNILTFKNIPNVEIFKGDSISNLENMINKAEGRIVFWLDGHYSGNGTGIGFKVSPIIDELEIIKKKNLKDACILIDDFRLFGYDEGYPTFFEVQEVLKQINPNYIIKIDFDCIVATPEIKIS